jgi:NADH dehydrogenase
VILVAGATGRLGTQIVRRLTASGQRVRVLTRDPARAEHVTDELVEVHVGDVRDAASLRGCMAGVSHVVSAMHGFAGPGDVTPTAVDGDGNHNLIATAEATGVGHFVLMSYFAAAVDHPMELCRMKYRAELELRASALTWTILRPTAFMETWVDLTSAPLLRGERAMVFGRGRNPVNFVSAHDVAGYVELAVTDSALRNAVLAVGGPDNLTLRQLIATFRELTGARGKIRRYPRPMLRLGSRMLARRNPMMAGHMRAGVVMDTWNLRFDPAENQRRFPRVTLTPVRDMIRRDYDTVAVDSDARGAAATRAIA